MTAAERLQVATDAHQPSKPLRPAIVLTGIHEGLIDQLVEATSRRTGEPPADVRHAVELAIVTRGIAALQEELGKA